MQPNLKNILWPTLIFTVAMLAGPLRALDFFNAIPGGLGDARFNSVVLEHIYLFFSGEAESLWSPLYFYPNTLTLAFSDNHLGTAPLYALTRHFGADREAGYQLWFLFSFPLNFFCCHYALRKFGFSSVAAAVGSFVFTFGLPVLAKFGHAQLAYRFAIPLCVTAAWDFFYKGRAKSFATMMLFLVWQFYCAIYLGFFLSLLLMFFVLTLCFLRVENSRRFAIPIAISALYQSSIATRVINTLTLIISIVAMLYLFYPYLTVSSEYNFNYVRSLGSLTQMLPSLASYLIADNAMLSSWPGSQLILAPMRHEHQLFIGYGATMLLFVGILTNTGQRGITIVRPLSIAAALVILFTISIDGKSAYLLLTNFSAVLSIQAVSRVIVILLFPICILIALGVDVSINPRRKAWKSSALLLCVISFMVLEVLAFQFPQTTVAEWRERIRNITVGLNIDTIEKPILYVSSSEGRGWLNAEIDGMIAAQNLGIPTVNGYSGNSPAGTGNPWHCGEVVARSAAYLHVDDLQNVALRAFTKRIVPVGLPGCRELLLNGPLPDPYEGKISGSFMSRISVDKLEIQSLEKGLLSIAVVIKNNNDSRLPAISSTGMPVRLTYKYSLLDPNTKPWNARRALTADVEANTELLMKFSIAAPPNPGTYTLEVSLVQDGVAWFHDSGMGIISRQFTIPAGQ